MSTETTFEDKAAFDKAIQSVRDDNSPMHYIDELYVEGSGSVVIRLY
jgi:hypothetical protein